MDSPQKLKMVQDSEKRFNSIMDKLFHAPKSTPNSSRGKKRPNPSSDLALANSRKRVDALERSWRSMAPAGKSPAPVCRPWDREDLMKRLATFKSMTWFAKPKVVSAVNCAMRGWVNIDVDIIACESCGARLLFSTPSSWSQEQVEKAALVFSLKLDNGHKLLCPWIDNACEERLAEFPPTTPEDLIDNFKERSSAILKLSALPVISSSAFEYMSSPQLDEFLRQPLMQEYHNANTESSQSESNGNGSGVDPANLYYQALKLISLCGWETRSLPYVVDCKTGPSQFVKDADIFNSSQGVYHGQNLSHNLSLEGSDRTLEENANSEAYGVENDPNSVVLDCRFCGASVGLWAFKTVPRPLEFIRLIGHVEINSGDSAPSHEHNAEERSIVVSGTNIGTSSKEQMSSLKLTIAGGPPPTKQNFKATISLPVVGHNLRARFSFDSEFNGWVNSYGGETQSEPKSNSLVAGKDPANCSIGGQIVPSEDAGPSDRNDYNEGLGSRSNELPPSFDTLGNEKGTSTVAASDSGTCNSVSEGNGLPGKQTNAGVQTVESNKVVAHSVGKESKQLPSDGQHMEFDPIKQHRHFCPWIISIGSRAPGWKQTLSALVRPKDASHSSTTSSPSSSSLIMVDDPLESVRRLFASPTPTKKRLKLTK